MFDEPRSRSRQRKRQIRFYNHTLYNLSLNYKFIQRHYYNQLYNFSELPICHEPANDHDAELRRPDRAGRQAAAGPRQRGVRRAPQAHLDHHDPPGNRHVDRQTIQNHVPPTLHPVQHHILDIRLLSINRRVILTQLV